MSRETTALLMAGPKTLGPWGDRSWRVSLTAQLVEGATPYWIATPTLPEEHPTRPDEIDVVTPNSEAVVESILMMLSAHFGDHDVEVALIDTHNISMDQGMREVARCYELSDEIQKFLAERLSNQVRLGVLRLTSDTLVNAEAVVELRKLGFDVEEYENPSILDC